MLAVGLLAGLAIDLAFGLAVFAPPAFAEEGKQADKQAGNKADKTIAGDGAGTGVQEDAKPAGNRKQFKLGEDGFKPQKQVAPDSPEGKLREVRRLLAADKPGEARSLVDDWIATHRRHALLPDAYLLRGDSKFAEGSYYKSLFDYELVARLYPGSEAFNTALEREYEIGSMFVAGVKRRVLGVRLLPTAAEGEELLIRIQERAPGSAIGEKASLRLADAYFQRIEMENAQVAFELFLVNYPASVHRERAMLMLIRTHLATFKGPNFDISGLTEALERIRQYRREFPVQAQQIGMDGIELRIRESLALKALNTANWYADRGNDVSARFLHRRLLRDYPDSTAARSSLKWLKEKGYDPRIPPKGRRDNTPELLGPAPPPVKSDKAGADDSGKAGDGVDAGGRGDTP